MSQMSPQILNPNQKKILNLKTPLKPTTVKKNKRWKKREIGKKI